MNAWGALLSMTIVVIAVAVLIFKASRWVDAVDSDRAQFRDFMQEFRDEFHAFRTEIRGEFHTFRTEMRDEFRAFRKEMRDESRSNLKEIQQTAREIREISGKISDDAEGIKATLGK